MQAVATRARCSSPTLHKKAQISKHENYAGFLKKSFWARNVPWWKLSKKTCSKWSASMKSFRDIAILKFAHKKLTFHQNRSQKSKTQYFRILFSGLNAAYHVKQFMYTIAAIRVKSSPPESKTS